MESFAVNQFLQRALADIESGGLATLDVYLRDSPAEHEAAIAREYDALSASIKAEIKGTEAHRDRIGPYRVVSEIGRGGQGRVLLATDTRLSRRVALKVLPIGSSDQAIARLRREGEIAARLDDPHVCKVYEVGEFDFGAYVALQYVRGKTLAARIAEASHAPPLALVEQATLPPPKERIAEVLAFVERVARSLDGMHKAGVFHRDVKPLNLMVLPDGAPMILDFGLARLDEAEGRTLTATEDVLGTPAYMAPELFDGAAVDARTDLWGLAVTAWEALTGERPFATGTREAMVRQMRTADLPSLAARLPAAPPELEFVLQKALEPAPGRRYSSAAEFADEISRILRHEPILARPAATGLRLRRFVQRHPVRTIAAALVAVSLGATGVAYWQRAEMAHERDRAETARRAAEEVASLTQHILEEVDPERGGNRLLRSVLERAQAMLDDGGLDQAPIIRARLLATMGTIHASLAESEKAIARHEAALALPEQVDPDSLEVAESLVALASAQGARDDPDAVGAMFERALAIRRTHLGPRHESVLGTSRTYANTLWTARQVDRCATIAERNLEFAGRVFGERSPEAAATMADVGMVYVDLGRLDEARELLEPACAIQREALGDHEDLLPTLGNLAQLYRRAGEPQQCEATLAARVDVAQAALRPGHAKIAVALRDLAVVRSWRDRESSLKIFQEALDAARAAYGASHPVVGEVLTSMGADLRALGRLDEAIAAYREAIRIFEALRVPRLKHEANARNNLAYAHLQADDHRAAADGFRAAIQLWTEHFGAAHQLIARGYLNLGAALQRGQDTAGGLAALESALAMAQEVGDAPLQSKAHLALGNIRACGGAFGEAGAAYREGLRLGSAEPPHDADRTAQLFGHGVALAELGELDRAEQRFREALELAQRHSRFELGIRIALAWVQFERGEDDAAREAIEELWPGFVEFKTTRGDRYPDERYVRARALGAADPRALEELKTALAYEENANRSPWRLARIRGEIGICLLERGEAQEARALLETALPVLESIYGPGHRRTTRVRQALQQD
ncbi:MAG: tetratricopeptide repeat protein [Planctomycetota bacterium]